jgi:glutathione S-transferase
LDEFGTDVVDPCACALEKEKVTMIKVFQFSPAWGLPNPSPPCMKLETWLRMTKIPYDAMGLDMSRAPKRKVPYIEDDGVLLGDSTFIIEYLEKKHDVHPDAHLSASEKAVSMAMRRMLKEHFYWVIVYLRWMVEANWAPQQLMLANQFPPSLPMEQRLGIADGLRPGALAALDAQGMGRHSPDEVCHLGRGDLTVMRDYLGDKPNLMGDRATTVDATAYAHIANVLNADIDSALRDWTREQKTLVDYCERMREAFFRDFICAEAVRSP